MRTERQRVANMAKGAAVGMFCGTGAHFIFAAGGTIGGWVLGGGGGWDWMAELRWLVFPLTGAFIGACYGGLVWPAPYTRNMQDPPGLHRPPGGASIMMPQEKAVDDPYCKA